MNKCKICSKKEVKGKGMCGSCCAKDWRKKNPKKVKSYAKMRYHRDKEKILKYTKEWCNKNKDKVVREKTIWRANHLEYDKLKERTRKEFSHLKNKCWRCPSKKDLQFHHIEPLSYDNFEILCRRCHLKEHGKLLESA